MCPPPMFHKLSYKLLTTRCVVSDCAPQSKSLSYASGICFVVVNAGHPTVLECIRLQGRQRRINIPQEIGTNYSQFGIFLLEDANGIRVQSIEHKHRGDAMQINKEILREWATGKGKKPVSWKTLTEVLHDIRLPLLLMRLGKLN